MDDNERTLGVVQMFLQGVEACLFVQLRSRSKLIFLQPFAHFHGSIFSPFIGFFFSASFAVDFLWNHPPVFLFTCVSTLCVYAVFLSFSATCAVEQRKLTVTLLPFFFLLCVISSQFLLSTDLYRRRNDDLNILFFFFTYFRLENNHFFLFSFFFSFIRLHFSFLRAQR